MKSDIHPDYHLIDVKLTNGDVVQMKSTWGGRRHAVARHRPLRRTRPGPAARPA